MRESEKERVGEKQKLSWFKETLLRRDETQMKETRAPLPLVIKKSWWKVIGLRPFTIIGFYISYDDGQQKYKNQFPTCLSTKGRPTEVLVKGGTLVYDSV
ncbi:unnamed protein product [Dovyalis caffra]|uniref:Uncharacterized protein n=1 Tax=Dovyalis caffra TaxID=77055 RepID=A0AAV1SSS6_9ROSI|nr:unnamed protein product [Dovyalis caffra]